jgi:hypothetical protein
LTPLLGNTYIGDPANTFSLGGQSLGKLPAGVSLAFGVSVGTRGELRIGLASQYNNVSAGLCASQGGSCSAYVTNLYVGYSTGNYQYPTYGGLDLAAMDACAIDAQQIAIAPDRAAAQATDNFNGTLRLPPGNVVAGTVVVGGASNSGVATLTLSNTIFAVTNAITLHKTARVTVNVTTQSCGIVVNNAADTAFNMDTATNGALRIVFRAPPTTRPFYGLSWSGDHVAAVQGLQAAGKLVTDNSGMAPRPVEIFKSGGFTYVGVPLPSGSAFTFR